MTDLSSLISRVEEGEGADRVIDGAIYDFLSTGLSVSAEHIVTHTAPNPSWLPRYTGSLDAVVSLIEQKLPGWGYYLRSDKDGGHAGCVFPEYSRVTPAHCEAKSPARALLAACLRALSSLENSKAGLADANSNPPDPKATP